VADISESATDRISFELIIAPPGDSGKDLSRNIRIGYELFTLFVAQVLVRISEQVENHFIFGALSAPRENQRVPRFEAELAYHQARTRRQDEVVVYGPDSDGVYTLYTAVVMRTHPRLVVEFTNDDLARLKRFAGRF